MTIVAAVMRKLFTLAYGVLRFGRAFDPAYETPSQLTPYLWCGNQGVTPPSFQSRVTREFPRKSARTLGMKSAWLTNGYAWPSVVKNVSALPLSTHAFGRVHDCGRGRNVDVKSK